MDEPPVVPESEKTPPDLDEKVFERNLGHARAAYSNAQETIRFVDSKTGILTGILTVTTGLPFALLQFMVSSESERAGKLIVFYAHRGSIAATGMIVPMALGIVFGALSLLSSTNGLMARQPGQPGQPEPGMPIQLFLFLIGKIAGLFGRAPKTTGFTGVITSLFPLFPPHRATEATETFARLGRGEYDRRKILEEFGYQLGSIGRILDTKINRNKDAVRWFELQIVCYMVAAAVAVVVLFCCHENRASAGTAIPGAKSVSTTSAKPASGNQPNPGSTKQPTAPNESPQRTPP